jgi:hypothetical protein
MDPETGSAAAPLWRRVCWNLTPRKRAGSPRAGATGQQQGQHCRESMASYLAGWLGSRKAGSVA